MEWSWMAGGFEWIIQSLREHIHPLQASIWAGQHSKFSGFKLNAGFWLKKLLLLRMQYCGSHTLKSYCSLFVYKNIERHVFKKYPA